MATPKATTQKTAGNGTQTPNRPASANAEVTADDRQLLKFIRANAQPIAAALSGAAAQAGADQDWERMLASLGIATQLCKLTGIPQAASPGALAQSATA